MKVAFLGTPRSGTRYMSNLMQECGLNVGHESMGANGTSCGFYVWADKAERLPCPQDMKPVRFDLTFHLCRHPLKSLRTMPRVLMSGEFESWFRDMGFWAMSSWDPRTASLIYWVETRRRLVNAEYPIVRVENIAEHWAMLRDAIPGLPGSPPDVDRNEMQRRSSLLTWSDLEILDADLAQQAQQLAEEMGYAD